MYTIPSWTSVEKAAVPAMRPRLPWPPLAHERSPKRAFEIAGRCCLVRIGEDEPRDATVTEIAGRLWAHEDATMLLTAVSEAVERYDPSGEAVILLETDSGFQVLILSPYGWDYVGGLEFAPAV
jgi:hypothetical protein